jgi:hypothetical protein
MRWYRADKGLRLSLLACAALSLAGGASAQVPWNPRAPENSQLRPTFNHGTVEEVLTAIGARHRRSSASPARPLIAVAFANNRRAVISLLSCNGDGSACRALGIQSSWNVPAGVPPARVAAAIEQFNRRYSFAKAFVAANGRITLQRYLTGDYGFIRGDLAVNLQVFANQADRFANEVVRPLGGR